MKQTIFILRVSLLIISLSLVILHVRSDAVAQPDKMMICFYSSETNINNFKSLKMEFDVYLSKIGAYEFQPFGTREEFEQHIKNRNNCLILLSSWHYSHIFRGFSLKPLLVGVQNGKHLQKPIMVGNEKTGNIEIAIKGPVASSSNEEYSRSILKEMFPQKEAVDTVRILSVPKDIDALMSVTFDIAKAALTTETMLNSLKTVDPMLFKKLKPLAEGKETLLLIVAIPEKFAGDSGKVVSAIKNMPNDSAGTNIIKSLNLDGWKPLEPSDKTKLEE